MHIHQHFFNSICWTVKWLPQCMCYNPAVYGWMLFYHSKCCAFGVDLLDDYPSDNFIHFRMHACMSSQHLKSSRLLFMTGQFMHHLSHVEYFPSIVFMVCALLCVVLWIFFGFVISCHGNKLPLPCPMFTKI